MAQKEKPSWNNVLSFCGLEEKKKNRRQQTSRASSFWWLVLLLLLLGKGRASIFCIIHTTQWLVEIIKHTKMALRIYALFFLIQEEKRERRSICKISRAHRTSFLFLKWRLDRRFLAVIRLLLLDGCKKMAFEKAEHKSHSRASPTSIHSTRRRPPPIPASRIALSIVALNSLCS